LLSLKNSVGPEAIEGNFRQPISGHVDLDFRAVAPREADSRALMIK